MAKADVRRPGVPQLLDELFGAWCARRQNDEDTLPLPKAIERAKERISAGPRPQIPLCRGAAAWPR